MIVKTLRLWIKKHTFALQNYKIIRIVKKTTKLLTLLLMLLMPLGTMAKDFYGAKNGNTLTIYYDDQMSSRGDVYSSWKFNKNIQHIIFDASVRDYRPTSLYGMFQEMTNLKDIKNLNYLDTRNVANMKDVFYGCSSLESVDLSGFNMQNVTSCNYMFSGCSSLKEINLRFLTQTGKVTNTGGMFYNCSSLTSVDLDMFETKNVTGMDFMFGGCSSLREVKNMYFDAQSGPDMSYVFKDCSALEDIDLSNFSNTQNIRIFQGVFQNCTNLQTVTLGTFELGNSADVKFLFHNCEKLKTIYCNSNWTKAKGDYVFWQCPNLTGGCGSTGMSDLYAAHPDVPGNPGVFTATEGLYFNGKLFTADNAQSFAKSGTISYDPDAETLSMDNATLQGNGGFWSPTDQSLWLHLKGENTISTKLTAICTYDVFPTALTDGASLDITSEEEYGISMKGGGAFSGDESLTGKLCTVNIYGYKGAVNGEEAYNSWVGKDLRPKLIPNNMILNLSAGSSQPVVSGLSEIVERDVAYNYDNYYYNDEKRAVYDCGVRPNGDGEGVVVTHPFKIVPKDKLVQYNVNLGGNRINNYNADDFCPMSLSSGKITYTDNVLKLKDAKFNKAYVPYDELYALYVEGNGFLLNLEGTNDLAGTDDDYPYGLRFEEDEKVDGLRQWIINSIDDKASLSLMGDMYCQSLGDGNQALLTIVDSKITVPDGAYFWQEDNVDLFIRNSELDLSCAKWPDQTIMESFCSVTLQDCQFADGCYWDAQKGVVVDSSGQPATGQVSIMRGGSTWKKGDVTGEGDVNSADVVAIYRYIIEGESSGFAKSKADVDGNGDVNSADVVAVYKIIINGGA